MNWRDFIHLKTVYGSPVWSGETRYTPICRVLMLRLPQRGFVWNTPVALQVDHAGQQTYIPIYDWTRWGQIALLGTSVVFLLFQRWQKHHPKER